LPKLAFLSVFLLNARGTLDKPEVSFFLSMEHLAFRRRPSASPVSTFDFSFLFCPAVVANALSADTLFFRGRYYRGSFFSPGAGLDTWSLFFRCGAVDFLSRGGARFPCMGDLLGVLVSQPKNLFKAPPIPFFCFSFSFVMHQRGTSTLSFLASQIRFVPRLPFL